MIRLLRRRGHSKARQGKARQGKGGRKKRKADYDQQSTRLSILVCPRKTIFAFSHRRHAHALKRPTHLRLHLAHLAHLTYLTHLYLLQLRRCLLLLLLLLLLHAPGRERRRRWGCQVLLLQVRVEDNHLLALLVPVIRIPERVRSLLPAGYLLRWCCAGLFR